MNALLRAYANAWSQAGAPHLAALANAIDAPEQLTSVPDMVPATLKRDYDQAIAGLSGFPELQR